MKILIDQYKKSCLENYGKESFSTAFIDKNISSNLEYRPQFLTNDVKTQTKVLSVIEHELNSCDEFCISVAFITMSGITPLLNILKELEKRGKGGRILTTDYLNYSEPKALEKLKSFKNVEIKMYSTDGKEGFHTKGYIFRKEEIYTIIVGSSNMTQDALTRNKEWNTRIVSSMDGEYTEKILNNFNQMWESDRAMVFEDFFEPYKEKYELLKKHKKEVEEIIKNQFLSVSDFQPNSMQVEFVQRCNDLIDKGKKRALLISATGTGKTYASAFFMRENNPGRVLFLAHREIILRQARNSYKKVIGNNKKLAILSGNPDPDYGKADYLFATMNMMAKDEIQKQFDPNHFDMIVVDEVHRAGSESYQKIMNYFKPDFYLGMTASPDRTDGFDIYGLFDHNIAQEIRLQQALENQLLCPFHYFGITDLEIDGEVFDDGTGLKNFNYLVSDDRVNHIINMAEYYGYSGNRVKGLVFCSRKDEAAALSSMFNLKNYKTAFLCSDDSQERREECIRRLESDDCEDRLDYIFSVDVFNEGVDIPSVNQILMLRPTESPIIFIQQLGRGLRKVEGKEYVVILDFIGNYTNNFMIPLALSGDKSYNKDTVRKYVREGAKIIPGSSTIHFDEVSRKRIFSSIDQANFNDIKLIKESYRQLKYKLGHIPTLMDFEVHGSIDPLRIFDNNNLGSYHKFLSRYEKDYTTKFDSIEELFIKYVSKKFASGKRPHELLALKYLINNGTDLFGYLSSELSARGLAFDQGVKENIVNLLTNNYATGAGKDTYSVCIFINQIDGKYNISKEFLSVLSNPEFKKAILEVIEFGLFRNKKDYSNLYPNSSFQLYSKYTYDDVCRLLNWGKGEVPYNIGGYKYDKSTKTYPVFINYDKSDDISDTTKYKDRFDGPSLITAISKNGRTSSSDDILTAVNADKNGIEMDLFVRKNKDDKISKEFYFLGRIHATGETNDFVMSGTEKTAVEIKYLLETPVRDDIYDYLVS